MAGKLKPLDVERETRPGKYPDGERSLPRRRKPHLEELELRYWKDGKQRWLGLGSLKDVSLKDARLVARHRGSDWLISSQFRMGRSFGGTRIWMLLATPG